MNVSDHCCRDMGTQIRWTSDMPLCVARISDGSYVVYERVTKGEFRHGIFLLYCPWCGAKLEKRIRTEET